MGDAPNKISITICGDGGCGASRSFSNSSVASQIVQRCYGNCPSHRADRKQESPQSLYGWFAVNGSTKDSYSVSRTIDGEQYFLSITDTAGQEEYRGLWTASNLKSDAFLLVYDITSEPSLSALDYFMEMIEMETDTRAEDNSRLMKDLGNSARGLEVGMAAPVRLVAGNKCDLKESRVISAKDGLEYARKHNSGFMETSAREMVNIEETFALLVRRVVEARRQHHQNNQELIKPTRHVGFSLRKPTAGPLSKKESDPNLAKQTNPRVNVFQGLFKGRRANDDTGQTEKKTENTPDMDMPEGETPSRWKRMCC